MKLPGASLVLLGLVALACVLTGAGCGCGDSGDSGHGGRGSETDRSAKPGDTSTNEKSAADTRPALLESASAPLRVTKIYSNPVELRFKGFIVKAGGDPNVIDPKFWDLQLNYSGRPDTEIVPLGGVWHGYRLGPLERTYEMRDICTGPGRILLPVYVLTVQRPGGQPIKLVQSRWVTVNETYANLVVAQGRDTGHVFAGKTVGETLPVNDVLYLIGEIRENAVVIKGPGEEPHELRPSGEEQGAAAEPHDDDKDGVPNDWEDTHKGTDRNKPDADADPDGDGFSNLKEYLGFSDPDDPRSLPNPLHSPRTSDKTAEVRSTGRLDKAVLIPLRVTRIYKKPIDVRFRGYVVRVGGDPDVIDPKFWDVQLNYGRESQTAIVPLDDMWQGYKLGPLEKIQVPARPGGRPREDYALTIQRPGGQAFRLVRHEWVSINEPCADLVVTEGKDNGRAFTGVVVGQSLRANGEQYRVTDISEQGVTIRKPISAVDPDR